MRQAAQARLLGSLLLLAASNAFGLGLGRVSTLSTLGNPLELSVGISAEVGDGLTPECVNAEVFVGDNRLPSELVRTRINRAADGTPISLRLVTGARIDEPVATVTLMLGCPTMVTRRYVVFIDPPSLQLAQSEGGDSSSGAFSPESVAPPPRSTPSRRRAQPLASSAESAMLETGGSRRPGRVSADVETSQVTAAPRRRRSPAPAASAPVAEVAAAGARLQLESAGAPRTGAPARSASAAGASASAISDLTAQVAANSLALDQERLRALEERFNRLRSDNEATKRSLAELEAGLRAAREDRFDRWVVYGLAATVALLLLALLFMLRRLLSQRNQSSWADGGDGDGDSRPAALSNLPLRMPPPGSGSSTALAPVADESPPDPAVEHSDGPWPTVAPEVGETQAGQAGVAAEGANDDDDEDHGHSLDQPQTMPGPNYGVLGAGAPATRHGVSIDELIDLEQQAEFFTVLGQDEAAIELLTGHVQSTGDASPLPYLKLLEIYRRRGEQSAYSRTRERFNRRFGATVPDWEDEPPPGHSIEEHAPVLERLQSVWPDPLKSMESLESLLFRRDPATPEFDLPVYSELLLLYSVARDLAERVVQEEVDLLLPLDELPGASPMPQTLGFDLLFDAAGTLPDKQQERSRSPAPLPDFHLDLLDIPVVPPSIAASNEPNVDALPPDVDRPSGRPAGG